MTTFTTPAPITAVVAVPAGNVRFIAADRADTVVEIAPADPTKNRDIKAAEQTTVDCTDGVLRIQGPARNQYFGPTGAVEATIQLPAGSHVEVKTASIELRAVGRFGNVTVASEHGSINLEEAAGARLTTVAGGVAVGRVTGPAEIRTSKGDIRITEAVRGSVTLRTDAGDISVGAAAGVSASLDAGTSHGRIRNSLKSAENGADQLVIHATTSAGDITAHSL
ncbi:DUF4097 family beta strand repeat-containing protein [Streptomyces sp. NPDC001793]|uniref:DUF4097 family beta strand repeat-containing protein n=1 Tax=Streptomyces sp. NPDC001793 TaxID=3154657 RepID=UPI00332595C6